MWSSTSRNAFLSGPGELRIYGTNQSTNITLYYSGNFSPGSVGTGTHFTGEFRDESGNLYTSIAGGNIQFSEFDTITRTVSGTFAFTARNNSGGIPKNITGGVFNVLNY